MKNHLLKQLKRARLMVVAEEKLFSTARKLSVKAWLF